MFRIALELRNFKMRSIIKLFVPVKKLTVFKDDEVLKGKTVEEQLATARPGALVVKHGCRRR